MHYVKGCWSLFVTQEIFNQLIAGINKYSNRKNATISQKRKREMKAAVELIYLLGIFRANQIIIEDAWATDGIRIEIFPTAMSWRRFHFLMMSMRFDHIHTRAERRLEDNGGMNRPT